MNSNSDNPKVGKDFQRKVLSIAQKTFNMPFDEEKVVLVGNPPKEHRFDVVSADGDIIIECKCYTWTNGGNVPSAKMSTLNEAVLYLRSVNYNARKILAMKKDVRLRTGESLAARELEAEDRIHVIDSENLSTGIGHLVVEAAVMAGKGMSAADIEKNILELRPRVRASFVVDTLTYLHRGGRCSGLAAMAGGVLKLHPRIEVNNGKMNPGKKYRGRMKNVVLDYVKDMEEDLKKAKKDRVFITHSGCDKEIVDEVKNYLKQLDVFDEIYETRAGGVISSHCGPGTLGVLFIAGE